MLRKSATDTNGGFIRATTCPLGRRTVLAHSDIYSRKHGRKRLVQDRNPRCVAAVIRMESVAREQ